MHACAAKLPRPVAQLARQLTGHWRRLCPGWAPLFSKTLWRGARGTVGSTAPGSPYRPSRMRIHPAGGMPLEKIPREQHIIWGDTETFRGAQPLFAPATQGLLQAVSAHWRPSAWQNSAPVSTQGQCMTNGAAGHPAFRTDCDQTIRPLKRGRKNSTAAKRSSKADCL